MKRLTRDNTVPLDKRYKLYDPAIYVDLGESFIVETINFRTPIVNTFEDANPEEFREREETGPIYINGISSGDIMAIHIEDIQPVGHASGGIFDDSEKNSLLRIVDDKVHFPGGLWAKKSMMIGDIYVTPNTIEGNPWDNGGNMDFKDICTGNILCLRAYVDGGLLVLGDVHACQGDGEIYGLGAECAADVRLHITKDDSFLSQRPLIIKRDSFVSIACRHDYAEARDLAAQDASEILARLYNVTLREAQLYCKTVGDLRNGAIWSMGMETMPWGSKQGPPLVVGLEVPLLEKSID